MIIGPIHQLVRGPGWLLEDQTLLEIDGQLIQLEFHHVLGVMPALLLPEEVQTHALHDDRQKQRPAQEAE